MKEDKELKKRIQAEFETPETPFEEWAKKRDLFSESEEKGTVDILTLEAVDSVNGHHSVFDNKKRIAVICTVIVAVILALSITLINVLPRVNGPKYYGVNDVNNVEIEFKEVEDREDIYLFKMADVAQTQQVTKDILKNNYSEVLLFTLLRNLISVKNGDQFDGFYLTYRIRLYQYYEFVGNNNYKELNNEVNVNNLKVQYKIVATPEQTAYASFSLNGYEYFIEAVGFQNVTVLNEDNFLNLLNEILI